MEPTRHRARLTATAKFETMPPDARRVSSDPSRPMDSVRRSRLIRLDTAFGALRIGTALTLSASVVLGILHPASVEHSFPIFGLEIGVEKAAMASEILLSLVLVAGKVRCTSGIAALSWAAATMWIRTSGILPSTCGCLRSLGGHPLLVNGIWIGILAIGIHGVIRGFRSPTVGFMSAIDLVVAAVFVGGAFSLTISTPADTREGPLVLELRVARLDDRREVAVLTARNRSNDAVPITGPYSSCSCVAAVPVARTLGPRDSTEWTIEIVDRPFGVVPEFEIRVRARPEDRVAIRMIE